MPYSCLGSLKSHALDRNDGIWACSCKIYSHENPFPRTGSTGLGPVQRVLLGEKNIPPPPHPPPVLQYTVQHWQTP